MLEEELKEKAQEIGKSLCMIVPMIEKKRKGGSAQLAPLIPVFPFKGEAGYELIEWRKEGELKDWAQYNALGLSSRARGQVGLALVQVWFARKSGQAEA